MARVVSTYMLISHKSGEKAPLKRKPLKKVILKHFEIDTTRMIMGEMIQSNISWSK